MEKKKRNKGLLIFIAITISILVLLQLYSVWIVATQRASVGGSCTVNHIDYVTVEGDGDCLFPMVSGNETSICALPADITCTGSAEQVPIIRFLYEAVNN